MVKITMQASSGAISAQWVKSGNNWYYVDANGKMVTGDYKINKVVYRFDAIEVQLDNELYSKNGMNTSRFCVYFIRNI